MTIIKALSIHQPWAWLIIKGYKLIENRDWETDFRGEFYVHASKSMTNAEYMGARNLAEMMNIKIPAMHQLERGGIVGMAEITNCVAESESPWFFGDFGFVLKNPRPLPFTPCRGQLNFFNPRIQVKL